MRYSGKIGFSVTEQVEPGVWEEHTVEKHYYGEVSRNIEKTDANTEVVTDMGLNNEVSIIGNSFLMKNIGNIRYIEWLGTKWRINTVQINYPRLVLSIGGLYHDPGDASK